MTCEEILEQAIAMLQRRGRVIYRALQRQFNVDEAFFADREEELIPGQQLVVDGEGKALVWIGRADRGAAPIMDAVHRLVAPGGDGTGMGGGVVSRLEAKAHKS